MIIGSFRPLWIPSAFGKEPKKPYIVFSGSRVLPKALILVQGSCERWKLLLPPPRTLFTRALFISATPLSHATLCPHRALTPLSLTVNSQQLPHTRCSPI